MCLYPDLEDYHHLYRGEKILVCGLGPSLKTFTTMDIGQAVPITIGVNDIGRYMNPDYLLVMDRPESFSQGHARNDALQHILMTNPTTARMVTIGFHEQWRPLMDFVTTWLIGVSSDNDFPDWFDTQRAQLHKYGSSTFTAASLAGFMGASDIGMIGVDLVNHPRCSEETVADWDKNGFARIRTFLEERGTRIVNCSPNSAIKSIPYEPLEKWLGLA